MKKIIAGSVNALFIILLLISIAILTFSSSEGNALSYIRQPDYISSEAFETKVSESVNDIFDYIDLKELFENQGKLDLKQVIAQGDVNGSPVSYSLDYLIKYARSMGYYLNEKNELMSNGDATLSRTEDEMTNQVRVTYRAYLPDYQPAGPADGVMSLGALAHEALTYLAKYYSVRAELVDNPVNLKFLVKYMADGRSVVYTNDSTLSEEDFRSFGRYLQTSSEDIAIRSNLRTPPSNLIPLLEAHSPYADGSYVLNIGIDTNFPLSDSYQRAEFHYESRRRNSFVGIVLLVFSLLSAAVSMLALVIFTGTEEGSRKIQLYSFDSIPTELLLLFFLLWVWISDQTAPILLESIQNILGYLDAPDFWESVLSFLLKYALLVPLILVLVRNYKAERLWKNSTARRLSEIVHSFIESSALTASRAFSYFMFLLPNLAGLLLIVALAVHFVRVKSLYAFLCALAVLGILTLIDLYAWRIATGLTKAVDEQVRSERLKADLITNVSHDLKTPLTSIINYVDLLRRQNIEDPIVQEYLAVLVQKSDRLKTLTEDLVEASKASSGNVNIQFSEINYSEIVLQALGEFEDKFERRKLEIISSIPEAPVMILADGRHLWRVIENLCNNCCKYALTASRVYVEVTEDEEHCSFTMKNISEAALNISPEELTERFVRGDVSRTTEGSGLGLSIAKSLTRLMNGELVISIDGDLYKASVIFPRVEHPENEVQERK